MDHAVDVRVGGAWRYLDQNPSGGEVAFSGEYREIVAPERIVRTSNFEPVGPGHEVFESVMFEEIEGGRTKMTTTMLFLSTEDRDAMLQWGWRPAMRRACGASTRSWTSSRRLPESGSVDRGGGTEGSRHSSRTG